MFNINIKQCLSISCTQSESIMARQKVRQEILQTTSVQFSEDYMNQVKSLSKAAGLSLGEYIEKRDSSNCKSKLSVLRELKAEREELTAKLLLLANKIESAEQFYESSTEKLLLDCIEGEQVDSKTLVSSGLLLLKILDEWVPYFELSKAVSNIVDQGLFRSSESLLENLLQAERREMTLDQLHFLVKKTDPNAPLLERIKSIDRAYKTDYCKELSVNSSNSKLTLKISESANISANQKVSLWQLCGGKVDRIYEAFRKQWNFNDLDLPDCFTPSYFNKTARRKCDPEALRRALEKSSGVSQISKNFEYLLLQLEEYGALTATQAAERAGQRYLSMSIDEIIREAVANLDTSH